MELLLNIKKRLCRLILQEDLLKNQVDEMLAEEGIEHPLGTVAEFDDEDAQTEYERLLVEQATLQFEIDEIARRVAANPAWAPHSYPWLIDIHGASLGDPDHVSGLFTKKIFQEAVNAGEVDAAMQKSAGEEYQAVIKLLSHLKYYTIEQVATQDAWNISVPCTERMAGKLCKELYKEFGERIEYDLIQVYKVFWGHRLLELWTIEDAMVFAHTHNIGWDDDSA